MDHDPATAHVERWALPGSAPAPSAPYLLLAPPAAQVRKDMLEAACARLAREPRLGAIVDFAAPERDFPSLALGVSVWPDRIDALLIRGELLRALPLGPDPADPLACAYWTLAVASAAELAASPGPLVETAHPARPSGEALERYFAAAIRAFAVEDLYPVLREGKRTQFVPSLLDWASRLLRRDAYVPGFALGEYATSVGDLRNEGRGPCLRPAPRREPQAAEPRVTFIVPTLDRAHFLARALRSLEEQTVQDFEVIVVNDGGRDPGAVLDAFRPRLGGGGRLTVVHHDRNRGLAAARNTGLRLARGRYVGFLDDDDRLLPQHLAVLLPALARGARAVHGDTRSVGEVADTPDALPCTRSIALFYRLAYAPIAFQLDNQLPVHAVLCERVLLLECGGFDESLPVLEDWDLWLRVFGVAPPVHVPRVVCEVRTREDGSRISQQHAARWPHTIARIYGKTMQRELQAPGLRKARLRHLLQVCRSRDVPFPRDVQPWLAGGPELAPIDPEDPLHFLESETP